MHIVLTGGTGLIGRALCRHWHLQGHQLWVWSRTPARVGAVCSGARGVSRLEEINAGGPIDAVVNLAGEPIADRPWTEARRALLWSSRVTLTRTLVDWMGSQVVPPPLLLSGSAVGIYGDRGEQTLTEECLAGEDDFGSRLCVAWEREALRASERGVRVALLRTAPVLSGNAGMLARLLPVYRLGLGGRLGSGEQWMPWIHIDDQVALIDHLLHQEKCRGAYNACAPDTVRNRQFSAALAQALHRPAILPAPAFALRMALGEMSVLLLGSQKVIPQRALESGFAWRYPSLDVALSALIEE